MKPYLRFFVVVEGANAVNIVDHEISKFSLYFCADNMILM